MSAIYLVKTPSGDRLIKAGSKSVAVNHAVKSMIEARSVTASELVELMDKGLTVEEAGKKAASTSVEKEEVGEEPTNDVAQEERAA